MPGENIQDWSTTAANNSTADSSINWAEGQARASVNNSARSMMAAHAKQRNLLNGSIVTGGTANAQTFFSGLTYSTVPTGLRVMLKIGPTLTNTAAATLEMDGLGAVAINNLYGSALSGSEIVADTYAEFLYDGTKWLLLRSSPRVAVQTFAASGTYTPSTAMGYCIIECVGGGGGGGSGYQNGTDTGLMAGSGGGSGGYSRKLATAATVGTSQVVTIGAGGNGGGGSANGTDGGNTSVGALCIAIGGGGGGLAITSGGLSNSGGLGGAAGTGDCSSRGAPGTSGSYLFQSGTPIFAAIHAGGTGGSSVFGGGGTGGIVAFGVAASAVGNAAAGYGSGGGGGASSQSAVGGAGGAGSAGYVVITEFRT